MLLLFARTRPVLAHPDFRVCSADQAKDYAAKMIGNKLITKQTGAAGRVVNAVRIELVAIAVSDSTSLTLL